MAQQSINVVAWVESLRTMVSGIGDPCYGSVAVLAMCNAVLDDARKLADRVALTIGGANATRMLRDSITQTTSRMQSYTARMSAIPNTGRSVDDLIVCESVLGYMLDGRTSDGTAPVLPLPEAQLIASMWNRAMVAAGTQLEPPPKSASDLIVEAGEDALASVGDAGERAAQAIGEWKDDAAELVKNAAEQAAAIAKWVVIGGIVWFAWTMAKFQRDHA